MVKVSEYIKKRLSESEQFRIEYEKEKEKLSKELEKLRKEKDLKK